MQNTVRKLFTLYGTQALAKKFSGSCSVQDVPAVEIEARKKYRKTDRKIERKKEMAKGESERKPNPNIHTKRQESEKDRKRDGKRERES